MHNKPLEASVGESERAPGATTSTGSSILSSISNVTLANKTRTMNPTFVVHGNNFFLINPRFISAKLKKI